jgi:succinate-semialdehyde dehydrogenase/glutarate-semialdehyde dehydrogenase
MYINGKWIETNKKITIKNPATLETYQEVSAGDASHVQQAIEAADAAFHSWSQLPAIDRALYLEKVAAKLLEKKEALAKTITSEMGKAITNARYEVDSTSSFFKWFAEEARRTYGETIPSTKPNKRLMEIKQPVGVVAAITPWNFPLSMGARKLAPALAAGCTVILRPSNASPSSAIELFKIFEECELPPGVVNLVIGSAKEVADPLLESPKVRKVSFTGSTEVGKELVRKSADTLKRVSMELGGHAPYIVFDDADLDIAVEGAITIKFGCAGQQCTSANRLYVHNKIYDKFIDKYTKRVQQLKVGNGIDDSCEVGPLISEAAIQKVQEHVEDAVNLGANLVVGGRRLRDGQFANGYFYEPTLLTDVDERMKISYEETFGPVAPVFRFETDEEVIEKANHAQYGLAAYFFTNDLSRAYKVMENLEFGIVGINDPYPFAVEGSFGGFKESGLGREGGHGIDEYMESKFVSIALR